MAENVDTEEKNVSDMFDDGLALFSCLGKCSEPSNSNSVQSQIKKSIRLLEEATRFVSLAGMFSSNETVEEISTNNIKFLLLPALLGTLTIKLCIENRIEVVQTAEIYFRDFLQRCKTYGIVDIEVPEPEQSSSDDTDKPPDEKHKPSTTDLVAMARDRNAKLQRYKELKVLESQLEDLRKNMGSQNVDDEVKRQYYLTMIKSYAYQAVDELHSIEMEKPLIEYMNKTRKGLPFGHSEDKKQTSGNPQKPLMPIIITKDEVQKKVFGAGYPSLPTMSVAEFYQQRVRDGEFPDPNTSRTRTLQDLADMRIQQDSESEFAEKEKKVEEDDPDTLRQTREWDEFKDEHRRGFGNRMNRS